MLPEEGQAEVMGQRPVWGRVPALRGQVGPRQLKAGTTAGLLRVKNVPTYPSHHPTSPRLYNSNQMISMLFVCNQGKGKTVQLSGEEATSPQKPYMPYFTAPFPIHTVLYSRYRAVP